MIVLIAGSRGLVPPPHELAESVVKMVGYVNKEKITGIISGGCKNSPDESAEAVAKILGVGFKEYPADWDAHGKAAGPMRNRQMAEAADVGFFLWDGKSKGTKGCYDYMGDDLGKAVVMVNYGPRDDDEE